MGSVVKRGNLYYMLSIATACGKSRAKVWNNGEM